MATQWYYKVLEEVIGPLSPSQLLAKVRDGVVSPDTRIRKDDSQWVFAKEVGGLFEAADTDKLQYTCPYCGTAVERPPTTCSQCNRDLERAYSKANATVVKPAAAPQPQPQPTPPTNNNPPKPAVRQRRSVAQWFRTRFRRK